jgi:hypothetical protein
LLARALPQVDLFLPSFDETLFLLARQQFDRLEAEVNAWIRKTGAKVVSVTGNIAPQSGGGNDGSGAAGLTQSSFATSDVLLLVVYEAPNA